MGGAVDLDSEVSGRAVEVEDQGPVGELPARLDEVPSGAAIATICEGGYRSSLAASLLAREGVSGIVNVTGGMAAYRALPEATRP